MAENAGSTSESFSFIPEIEDEIFEWAARMAIRSAPSLTVVSRRVQKRIEAIIYDTIRLSAFHTTTNNTGTSYYERFMSTLRARPAEFFAQHVHNLCITAAVPRFAATEILAKCTGVRNLALWQYPEPPHYFPFDLVVPFSATLTSLSMFKLDLCMLADIKNVSFPRVTQLTVALDRRAKLPTLAWLPSLTSVEIDFGDQPEEDDEWLAEVTTALSTAPLLQSLIVMVNTAHAMTRAENVLRGNDSTRIAVVNSMEHDERWFADFYYPLITGYLDRDNIISYLLQEGWET
ncbi:hypothetical protein LshimejAT787_0401010 [Lyophyllum shimeji]|uniref:Uncharacterized protein n=1 Tax=Lyophyllum shimeji TaxID=47721 RepID=A0A9P3PIY5_LYOSH|nr:hypothetical protein LshimejAT787_0401010 [Lyophyllum shimeji]